MKITVICDECQVEMVLNEHEADQDEALAGFDCPDCGTSFYGVIKESPRQEDEIMFA